MSFRKFYVAFAVIVCAFVVLAAALFSKAKRSTAQEAAAALYPQIVIDAGHGGEDGGTVSAAGVHESKINLEIALRLNDFLRLLGADTQMIRTEDVSVYTDGQTIAQRKVSDIRQRVRIVNAVPNALLISIHQNHFTESKYRGAQVFFAKGSDPLAEHLQAIFSSQVDPQNHRQPKKAENIYLMEHINCPAVLIECGFLSNPSEALLLQEPRYQKKLTAAIACGIMAYTEDKNEI